MKRNNSFHVGRTLRLFSLAALFSPIVTLNGIAQDKPQLKVDISIAISNSTTAFDTKRVFFILSLLKP